MKSKSDGQREQYANKVHEQLAYKAAALGFSGADQPVAIAGAFEGFARMLPAASARFGAYCVTSKSVCADADYAMVDIPMGARVRIIGQLLTLRDEKPSFNLALFYNNDLMILREPDDVRFLLPEIYDDPVIMYFVNQSYDKAVFSKLPVPLRFGPELFETPVLDRYEDDDFVDGSRYVVPCDVVDFTIDVISQSYSQQQAGLFTVELTRRAAPRCNIKVETNLEYWYKEISDESKRFE